MWQLRKFSQIKRCGNDKLLNPKTFTDGEIATSSFQFPSLLSLFFSTFWLWRQPIRNLQINADRKKKKKKMDQIRSTVCGCDRRELLGTNGPNWRPSDRLFCIFRVILRWLGQEIIIRIEDQKSMLKWR